MRFFFLLVSLLSCFFYSCSSWFNTAVISLICLHSNICHCTHESVLPETLNTITCCDNGPQYDCREFHKFARQYGLEYVTSRHFYQKCNGQEKEVKTKAVDSKAKPLPYLAWLRGQATSLDHGASPAVLMMYHNLCIKLPRLRKHTNRQRAT